VNPRIKLACQALAALLVGGCVIAKAPAAGGPYLPVPEYNPRVQPEDGAAPEPATPPRFARHATCGDRAELLAQLAERYDETPQALGLSYDGGVLEVLVSPEGGWTILVTYPLRPTCIVAVGEGWQQLQLVGQPA